MKKITVTRTILVILMLFPLMLLAQEVKKVKLKIKEQRVKEEYYVLKSDMLTKHGRYKRYLDKRLIENGFYKNGRKDSTWIIYDDEVKLAEGKYSNDVKTGIWIYYDRKGNMVHKYDHDTKKTLYVSETLMGAITPEPAGEILPQYIGGTDMLGATIRHNVVYPRAAIKAKAAASVYVSFVVEKDGSMSDVKVLKGADPALGFDEEALRVVKTLDGNWIPGEKDGNKIRVSYTLPIRFKLK